MRRKNDKFLKGSVWFLAITMMIYIIFRTSPSLTDLLYGGIIYPFIRFSYDWSIGNLNVPMVYIILTILLLLLVLTIVRRRGANRLITIFTGLLIMIGLFFWAWGFNYMRPNTKQRLDLVIPEVDIETLELMFCELTENMPAWRRTDDPNPDYHTLENRVRLAVTNSFQTMGLATPGRPRVRRLHPEGILLGSSTAGIYIPYAMEAHFDAGLHPLVWPHVMAHELSHAYGVTDEGECNFLASVACAASSSNRLKYSAALHDLRYVFSALVRSGKDREHLSAQIQQPIHSDLKSIREKHQSYPEYIPDDIRNWIYDSYLKSQGVESGLSSYGEVLGLLVAWRIRHH